MHSICLTLVTEQNAAVAIFESNHSLFHRNARNDDVVQVTRFFGFFFGILTLSGIDISGNWPVFKANIWKKACHVAAQQISLMEQMTAMDRDNEILRCHFRGRRPIDEFSHVAFGGVSCAKLGVDFGICQRSM